MTDPVGIGLTVGAVLTALVAGWLQLPRAPELDGERWFKLTLATLLLGEVEGREGTEAEWSERVLRFVPYHPAGRLPERKVVQPLFDPPGKRLDGELALQEKLAGLPTLEERWAWMYDQDEAAVTARLDDPFELGEAYNPGMILGKDHGWDALAKWGAGDSAFREALLRRVGVRWVLVEGPEGEGVGPSLAGALQDELPELHRLRWTGLGGPGGIDARVKATDEALRGLLERQDERLVLLAEGDGAAVLLRVLKDDAPLRDVTFAVVSLGGNVGGRPAESGPFGDRDAQDWLERWFTLDAFDTDIVRLTPYLSLQWLDRSAPVPGCGGLPLEAQRIPEPRDDDVERTVESVDLGPLVPVDDLPLEQVARAVVAVTGLWILTRS